MMAPASNRDLVLIVVLDGMRRDLIETATMPNLRAFMERGCDFAESCSVFPSSTRVNACALGTGATPSRNGIVANKFFDSGIEGGYLLHTGELTDIARAEAAAGGRYVTAPSLGDILADQGLTLSIVSTASAGTTHLVNPRARANWQASLCLRDWRASGPADFAKKMLDRFGPIAPSGRPNAARIAQQTTMFLDGVYPELRPDVAIIWYNDPDITFHHEGLGSPPAVAALAALDREFGRLLDWANSPAPDRAVQIVLVSDHGHITARERVAAKKTLAENGFNLDRAPSRDGLAGTFGYLSALHATAPDAAKLRYLVSWLAEQPWCGSIFTEARNDVEGIVPGTLARSLLLNNHRRSPHLFCIMRADDRLNHAGIDGTCYFDGEMPVGGSVHGGLHRREMNNLLTFGGSAFRTSCRFSHPAGIIDVAPTVLTLLGIAVPEEMEGRTLTEAFIDGTDLPASEESTCEVRAPHGVMTLRRANVGSTTYVVSGGII
jgi:predicted AlkP superfamily pyrophosphatase or phosphodiesterase